MKKSAQLLLPALALLAAASAQAQTTVSSGYVQSVGAGTVTLNGGGLLAVNDTTFTVNNNIVLGSNGGLFRAYDSVAGGPFGIGAKGDGSLVINGSVSGSGGAVIQDGGRIRFNGSNSYTGDTVFENTGAGNPSVYIGNVNAFSGSTVILTGFQPLNFSVAGNNTYNFGGLRGNQNLGLGANTLSVGANNQNISYNAALSGTGGFVKVGSGTQTLGGNNSFTGGTVINNGTLALGSANRLADSGAVTVNAGALNLGGFSESVGDVTLNGGTITNGTLSTLTGYSYNLKSGSISASLAGNAGIIKTTAGTVILSGSNNSFTGGTFINGGTLALGAANQLANAGTLGVESGAVLDLGGFSETVGTVSLNGGTITNGTLTGSSYNLRSGTISAALAGSAGITKEFEGTVILSGSNTYSGTTTIRNGILQIGNGGTTGNLGSGSISKDSGGILAINRSDSVTLSNTLTGDIGFRQIGTGTTVLTGTRSYSGVTMVTAGTLKLGSAGEQDLIIDNALIDNGTGNSRDLSIDGGTLINRESRIGIAAGTTGRATVKSGAWNSSQRLQVGYGGTGYLELRGGTISSLSSDIALNSGSVGYVHMFGGTWNSGSQFIVGGLSNAVGTVYISGGTLSNSNGFVGYNAGSSGRVDVYSVGTWNNTDGLTVGFSGSGTLVLANGGTITVGDGSGTLRLGENNGSTGTLNLGDGAPSAGSLIAAAVTGGNGTSIVNVNSMGTTVLGQSFTVSSFNQLGRGTTILAGANYTASNVISAGTLATGGNERILDTGSVTVNTGGTFKLGGNETIASLNGAGTANVGANNLTLSSGNFSGALAGSGDLYKTGADAFTLSGTSAGFTGDLYLQGGSVVAGSSTALNANNFVLLSAGSTFTANQNLVLGGIDQNGGTINGSGVITAVSTITRSGALNSVLGDVVGYNSGVLKLGTGTTTLGAANTYTGTTKVSEGTLALGANGSFASTSSAQIASGATLDLAAKSQTLADAKVNGTVAGSGIMTVTGTLSGSGTINADTVVTGIHSPGNSPGIQTFNGNLTYQSGAGILLEFADNTTVNSPVAYDQILVGKDLNFSGLTSLNISFGETGSAVDWNNAFWQTSQSWTLYSVSGLTTGFENLTLNSTNWSDANGLFFSDVLSGGTFSLAQSGKDIVLNYAIPEPSTYALMGLGALALVIAYRRKRA